MFPSRNSEKPNLTESKTSKNPAPNPKGRKHLNNPSKSLTDEAIKVDMVTVPTKTPVSLLQELLSRRGLTPNYELVQVEGAIHEPTFRYRVTIENHVAMGTGRSKRDAKHAAAKALLNILVGSQFDEDDPDSQKLNGLSGQDSSQNSVMSYEEKGIANPIGWLQEMCMMRRWPPPFYEMENEEGAPHERMYTISCQVFQDREVGTGKSKKLAKRQAAYKMGQALQKLPPDDPAVTKNTAKNSKSSHFADLKDSKIVTLTTSHSHKVSQFHKTLKMSSGKKLSELQTAEFKDKTINFVQFLQEIAAEQQFEVTYVDIEEKSYSGKYQCLVQLSTLPVAVCYGSGKTSKDAQSAAAQNALEYLKIMTKK